MNRCILIHGNPVDGFSYIGPFATEYQANAHADKCGLSSCGEGDYWVATLDEPTEEV